MLRTRPLIMSARTAARVLRSTKSNPSLRQAKSLPNIRGIRTSTPSTNPSALLATPTQYASQSVASLKAECRKKGLKVSGRKADLVDRLCAFDASKLATGMGSHPISTSTPKRAKDDSSTVDYCLMPLTDAPTADDTVVFKIPVPPDAYSQTARDQSTSYHTPKPDGGQTERSQVSTGTEGAEQVHVISPSAHVRQVEEALPRQDFTVTERDPYEGQNQNAELKAGDKTFLAAFAATVVGWFALGKVGKKKDHN
uniref:ARAD1D26664p n=1 Tax=Blastobotrys adeninivorans TaxID=409370 RepID=A0A060TFY1_BLAAD